MALGLDWALLRGRSVLISPRPLIESDLGSEIEFTFSRPGWTKEFLPLVDSEGDRKTHRGGRGGAEGLHRPIDPGSGKGQGAGSCLGHSVDLSGLCPNIYA